MFQKNENGNFALAKEFRDNMSGKILVNALEHFAVYGYVGANIRSITQSSGVTKPTLYYYFKNKEHLYREVAKQCFDYAVEGIKVAAKSAKGAEKRLFAIADEMGRLCRDGLPAVRFAFMVGISTSDGLPDVGAAAYIKQLSDLIDSILDEGVAAGEVNREHLSQIRFLVKSALLLHGRYLLGTGGVVADTAYGETFQRALKQALS